MPYASHEVYGNDNSYDGKNQTHHSINAKFLISSSQESHNGTHTSNDYPKQDRRRPRTA